MAATRLPGKPLLKIKGKSIISHVFKKSASTLILATLIVATEDQDIVDDVVKNGGSKLF